MDLEGVPQRARVRLLYNEDNAGKKGEVRRAGGSLVLSHPRMAHTMYAIRRDCIRGAVMSGKNLLGEFEQLVLLAILQHRDHGYAILIRGAIEEVTDRAISRGALYRTLDRLESKGLVTWELESPTRDRGGNPRKRFDVTPAGLDGLRRSRSVVSRLSAGLEDLLEPAQ